MNLFHVFSVGSQSLLIMFATIGAAGITAWLVGRYLQLPGNISTLIGVGTAICGGSAIAATAPVISATDKEVAYSISTIFLFNIAAVFIFPFLGHFLGMNDIGFGMWAGTAINDTSSVVAAGYSYSQAAGNFATIVKLTRTLMIIPITLGLALYTARKSVSISTYSFATVFPWFILGFLIRFHCKYYRISSSVLLSNPYPSRKVFHHNGYGCHRIKHPFKTTHQQWHKAYHSGTILLDSRSPCIPCYATLFADLVVNIGLEKR